MLENEKKSNVNISYQSMDFSSTAEFIAVSIEK